MCDCVYLYAWTVTTLNGISSFLSGRISFVDWFIPFFRVNELRVLRDDDDEEDNNDVEHQQDSTETEEPTETDDALERDSSEGFEVIAARNPSQASSWVDLLNRNSALGGDDHDQVEMPSLTSYSSSNSTATTK